MLVFGHTNFAFHARTKTSQVCIIFQVPRQLPTIPYKEYVSTCSDLLFTRPPRHACRQAANSPWLQLEFDFQEPLTKLNARMHTDRQQESLH